MTPHFWAESSVALAPFRRRIALAAVVASVALAAVVAAAANGLAITAFLPIFGISVFVLAEGWGVILVCSWFGETAERRFQSLSPGWRRTAAIAWRWYAAVFLVLWFLLGFVFLLVPLGRAFA